MTVTYSEIDDLLIGDLRVSDGTKLTYLVGVGREIDSKLGVVYDLPIDLNALEQHSRDYLRNASNFMSSGRLIMSLAVAGEDQQVNPYGSRLLREGQAMLEALASLQILLDGATRRSDRDDSRLPVVINRDEESATQEFERNYMRGVGTPRYWRPGDA